MIRILAMAMALLAVLGGMMAYRGMAADAQSNSSGITIRETVASGAEGKILPAPKKLNEQKAATYFDEFLYKFKQGGLTMYALLFLSMNIVY